MQQDDYNIRYSRFSVKIEKILIVLSVVLTLLLILGECMYQLEPVRNWLVETIRLEGIRLP